MGEVGVRNSNSAEGWRSTLSTDPASFSEECLSAAEEAAHRVINYIHPTMESEDKRRDVIDYVQTLFKTRLNCEVFPYGSVPLKTYLPDGDIDLTVLKGPNADDSLAHKVLALIQMEEKNEYAQYEVKGTLFIDAEVKLVKCLIQNIVVDLSFNQLGGLSTLCFLEQVDRLFGRDHLFKRSIILVKAWCYYESRILGAHHGLLSTYALETLVLYIFNFFHSSLNGPLEVLYKFLDYYSQFDWENYCISLKGPVCVSSLPDIVVKMPEGAQNDKVLSNEFLDMCIETFAAPPSELDEKPKVFQTKHLNIIDPLKEYNNLGRSVYRGNFYRIRSAFKYGACKLRKVLLQPKDNIANEINKFFTSVIARHGQRHTNNVRRMTLDFTDEESLTESISSLDELFSDDDILMKSDTLSDFDNYSHCSEEKSLTCKNAVEERSVRDVANSSDAISELPMFNSSLRNNSSDHTSSCNYSMLISGNQGRKATGGSSKPSAESGSLEIGKCPPANISSQKFSFMSCPENREKHWEMKNPAYSWCMDEPHGVCKVGSDSLAPMANNSMEDLCFDFGELEPAGDESDSSNPLASLNGEYECYIRSLLYGQFCNGVSSSMIASKSNPAPSSTSGDMILWDIVHNSFPFAQNQLSQMNFQAVSMDFGPMNSLMEYPHMEFAQMNSRTVSMQMNPQIKFSQVNSQPLSMEFARTNFSQMNLQTDSMELNACHATGDSRFSSSISPSERKQKARGTGTYIPNVNRFYKDKQMQERSRNNGPTYNRNPFHKHGRNNGFSLAFAESNNNYSNFKNGSHQVPLGRSRSLGQWRPDIQCKSPHPIIDRNQTNDHPSESCKKIEFGSVGKLVEEAISESVKDMGSEPPVSSLETKVTTTTVVEKSRATGVLIHLKNEQEFPPLCPV